MRPIAFALLLLTALAAGTAAADDTMWQLEGSEERVAAARADARALARGFLPGPDALGEGWFRPWEAPHGVPGLVRSEERFWRRFPVDPEWGQFFGLDEAQIVARIRKKLDEYWSKIQGEIPPGVPPELAALAKSKASFLGIPMMSLRKTTMLAQMPQVLAVERFEAVGHAFLRARFTDEDADPDQLAAEQMPALLEAMGADLSGLSYAEAVRAYAREARSVRRKTQMVFVRADAEAWKAPRSRELPTFAVFTVDLHVLAREDLDRVHDVTAENLAATQARLAASLAKTWDLTKEIAGLQIGQQRARIQEQIDQLERTGRDAAAHRAQLDRLDEQARTFARTPAARPELSMRDLADNAWVLSLEDLPKVQSQKLAALQARLRNGNAIADVQVRGTYPKAYLVETLDFLLAALDESTRLFAEE